MACTDMRCVCVKGAHTVDCQHNVTLASQVLMALHLFFPSSSSSHSLCRLLLNNESEMMAVECGPILIPRLLLLSQHNFQCLFTSVSSVNPILMILLQLELVVSSTWVWLSTTLGTGRSFKVCSLMLEMFYQSVMASTFFSKTAYSSFAQLP